MRTVSRPTALAALAATAITAGAAAPAFAQFATHVIEESRNGMIEVLVSATGRIYKHNASLNLAETDTYPLDLHRPARRLGGGSSRYFLSGDSIVRIDGNDNASTWVSFLTPPFLEPVGLADCRNGMLCVAFTDRSCNGETQIIAYAPGLPTVSGASIPNEGECFRDIVTMGGAGVAVLTQYAGSHPQAFEARVHIHEPELFFRAFSYSLGAFSGIAQAMTKHPGISTAYVLESDFAGTAVIRKVDLNAGFISQTASFTSPGFAPMDLAFWPGQPEVVVLSKGNTENTHGRYQLAAVGQSNLDLRRVATFDE